MIKEEYSIAGSQGKPILFDITKPYHSFNVSHPFTADTIPEAAWQVINSSIDFTLS